MAGDASVHINCIKDSRKEVERIRKMEESQQAVIAQTTVTLPFLDDEVPALYLADGRPYIPVCVVCRALGIRADIHIRRWRKLVL